MNRLHVHIAVAELERSIRYYTTLFGTGPSVSKPDYAKWMLDDPRVNFAISARGQQPGLDHLGIQVADEAALAEVSSRLARAGEALRPEPGTTCCYAHSDKAWSEDPNGLKWETFLTLGESTTYGEDAGTQESACCAPAAEATCC